jgi:hemerythrin-like metal-binding protein
MQWSEKFENQLERMDNTHREFVEHYNQVAAALGTEGFVAAYDEFVAHTEAHFAQENRWMEAVNFPACHRGEHDRVLTVLRDIRKRVEQGDLFFAKRLIQELPAWFDNHTNGMDAALAFHLQSVGYDVDSETLAPQATDSAAAGCACAVLSANPEPEHQA